VESQFFYVSRIEGVISITSRSHNAREGRKITYRKEEIQMEAVRGRKEERSRKSTKIGREIKTR
jgi:hypothetical protein